MKFKIVIRRFNRITQADEHRSNVVEADTEAPAREAIMADVRKVMDATASFMRNAFGTPESIIDQLYESEQVEIVSVTEVLPD